ncbi:hypothetical protein U4E84_13705 [Halorubrum sp. AD140]|uniref:hypothetical protein n=1 Tax=Halorubrum sp. AD140 TaxID=3050073 RepID=UPI002ACC4F7B|nr:hypothetical protein [Halorubrum sp. AD140]MDZ5812400.1 hypothetical protein [Halorubrum sp. AD140]
MLKTEPELYEVAGAQNNHLWLEVLEGPDQGLRVSVPVHSSEYTQETQDKVLDLEVGNVYKLTLVSDQESPPDWKIEDVHSERGRRIEKPA